MRKIIGERTVRKAGEAGCPTKALPFFLGLNRYGWRLGVALIFVLLFPVWAEADVGGLVDGHTVLGIKLRIGGRYDNVRMCVGSPAGVHGGPAMDVSLFTQIELTDSSFLEVDLPVARPILFGAAFQMLQFEPSVSWKFRRRREGQSDLILGPTLGVSLHYGPDVDSERSGEARGPSFFAMGPILGGFVGLDWAGKEGGPDFQLGITPYVTPLFGIGDPDNNRGWVIGGLIDGLFPIWR